MRNVFYLFFSVLTVTSCITKTSQQNVSNTNWEDIMVNARGERVTLMMWLGDPLVNAYMNDYVVPRVKELYDIDLDLVSGQGNVIVSTLMTELEAGKATSELDMLWINGETFYQLRQINGLYGPFVSALPNNGLIDWENPFIKYDFQREVAGYECPWGNVQFALIYNEEKVPDPPQDMEALATWIKAHPGKFTLTDEFTGMTLLKSWLIYLSGGPGSLDGPFDEVKYEKYSEQLWEYVNRIKPYFWNDGESFPASLAQMHQLFANGEIWFTMSNNDSEADNKIAEGVFPVTSRAYVPETGTIRNSHYIGVVKHSDRKEAAMVVINFLISPEAQWTKMQPVVWGDGTVLAIDRLPREWQEKFHNIPERKQAPERKKIAGYALREPDPEYMIRLFGDFRKHVIEN